MNALAVIAEPALPVVFEAELELASDFAKASKSAATLKAYRTDFSIFEDVVPRARAKRTAGQV
jgi:hypothetical protein